MNFNKNDRIEYLSNIVKHESAGGFVFFEDPATHELFVALLQKADGYYVIPKGHIKKNETPEMAAIREIKEELSLIDNPQVISFIGISSYTFTLDDPKIVHKKNVHNYVFRFYKKMDIKPQKEEGYEKAEWVSFETALEKISFDKENLLKAKQSFYYNKPVKIYNNSLDISSITVVVPTHNGSKTIKNTLFSIEERVKEIPYPIQKEIIVCTDHCTDNTKIIVEDFIKNSKTEIKIKLIENNGLKGKATVLNKLFGNSSGELFCTIDDDVILEKECLISLLKELVSHSDLRCVFSVWKRLPFKSSNPFKLFWHWVLGVKFDIQPYDKPQEFMRGACMMFRRDNFVLLPPVLNEDQFIQYIYWPKVKETQTSILYFNSISNIFDYYKRSLRIMVGYKQLSRYFTQQRIKECASSLSRKLNYKKIMTLPWRQKVPFLLYLCIKNIINIYRNIKLRFIKNYEWFRFKQG
jgi:8-oxo-dGTP pyrophosphatase MutT (NUDIX family)/glycosyltransferase involved in cell wall biosynthesis